MRHTIATCRNCGRKAALDGYHKHPARFCSRRCSQLYRNKLRQRMTHETRRNARKGVCHAQ